MVWDGIVACDLFFAGLGAWAFVFTALAGGRGAAARKVKLVGMGTAFVAVALGALILAVDARGGLLNPLRYLNLLGNFGSVMTWGVVLISLFLASAFACLVLLALRKDPPRALELVGSALGVGVSLYTGVLLSTAPAFPLWNLAVLPAAFAVSAAYTGYAAYGLAARIAGADGQAAPAWMGKAGIVLPVAEALLVVALLAVVSATQGSAALSAAASVAQLLTGAYAAAFWGGVVVVGLAAPCALAVVRGKRGEAAPGWIGPVEWICILVGGLAFRYVVVMAAVPLFA